MPAPTLELGVFQVCADRFLLGHDGRSRFECHFEIDMLTIGNASLNATGAVRAGSNLIVLHIEGVIVFSAGELCAFEAGADDFILKPIKPRALLARISTLIKRFNENLPSQSDLEIFDLNISPDSYTVTQAGEEISLSKLEFDLLYFMASHPGKVFNRSQLLSSVWDNTIVLQRTVDVHIRKLRKLLGNGYIDTVKGVGYKFVTTR